MVNRYSVVDAIRSLTQRQSDPPTTGDIAAALDCTPQHVRSVVSALVADGVVLRVGRSDRPGLVMADSTPIPVLRLRALIARVEAKHAADFAAEIAELRALEADLVTVPGRLAVAT